MFRGKGEKKLGKVGWVLVALAPYVVLCLVLLLDFFLTYGDHCPLPTFLDQDFWVFPSVVQSWLFYALAIPLVELILIPFGFLFSAVWFAVRSIFKPELRKGVWRRVFRVLPFAVMVVGSVLFGGLFVSSQYVYIGYALEEVLVIVMVAGFVLTVLASFGVAIWLLVAGILEKRNSSAAVRKQGTRTIVAAVLNLFAPFVVLLVIVVFVLWNAFGFSSYDDYHSVNAVSIPATASTATLYSAMSPSSAPAFESDTIGFAVGGAKDIDNFRENIDACYLPVPTDVTYQGLYFDYQFATQNQTGCSALFCPQYEAAVLPDPFSKKDEYFLSVGLGSGVAVSDFARPPLDVVVVLDISGSMGSPFDQYYYDRFRTPGGLLGSVDDWNTSKMEIAKESVQAMVDHLREDDRFGMVLFESDAEKFIPFRRVGDGHQQIKDIVATLSERGGTNMEAGMTLGTQVIESLPAIAGEDRERRIIFLTDAMPNIGALEENELYTIGKGNAQKGIHTTFIGIGVDFNTELVEALTNDLRGSNYFAVHSSSDFERRLDTEFEYLIAPLLYDLTLTVEGGDYAIQAVYGSPEADAATGDVLRVASLFPSPTVAGESRGGVLLAHLKQVSYTGVPTRVIASYTDRQGVQHSEEQVVHWSEEAKRSPSANVRKAALLARYVNLLQNWAIDENLRQGPHEKTIIVPIKPIVFYDEGLIIPRERYPGYEPGYKLAELSQWERLSRSLVVSEDYKKVLRDFMDYFQEEYRGLSEKKLLKRELQLLDDLIHSPDPGMAGLRKMRKRDVYWH